MGKIDELIQQYCPDGVEFVPLSSISELIRGKVISKDYIKDNEGDYPVYSSQSADDGVMGRIDTYMYDGDYITWTTDGAYAGTIFRRSGKFNITNVCGLVKVISKEIILDFLYYWLYVEAPKYVYRGMGNPKLMSNVMGTISIPLPPLPVQEAIVNILDRFAVYAAELQAELQARQQQYNYYRDTLLSENNSYRKCKIIDLLSQPITDGPHTTPQFFDDGIPFVSVDSVWDGRIHFENKRGYISPEFDKECSKKYKPRKHDVLMVKSGSTTGKVAYVDTDESFNIWSPLAAMRVNEMTSSRYLFHLLQTSHIQEQVASRSSQGSQPNLGMRVLEQFDVSVPPLSKQIEIASILDRFDTLVNDLSQGLPAEIEARQQQYEYYRDRLLTFKRK